MSSIVSAQGLRALRESATKNVDAVRLFAFAQELCDQLAKAKDTDLPEARQLAHECLDLVRRSEVLRAAEGDKRWEILVLELVQRSGFDVGELFAQRAAAHPDKVLFRVLRRSGDMSHTWDDVRQAVEHYRRGLVSVLAATGDIHGRVAFLLENSLEMAELDLACLTSGIVNVIIPANAPTEHISFILEETGASVLLVHDDRQLARVQGGQEAAPGLKRIVQVHGRSAAPEVMSLADLVGAGNDARDQDLAALRDAVLPASLATIMYTSGTTGEPKGITFSHTNIVYKRFCRALALPEIGPGDRFLCYLPLFHTFGRWFEMMGCVFWGATYHFLPNPAVETIVESMQRVRPTIFISIPQKWQQLYEAIAARADPELADDAELQATVDDVTGSALRFGLSAAGYLAPEVFRFFQRYGTELMSGFGMTEATGGITMTPPGGYSDNSLGRALPGIELKIASDGELLIRGPYVTPGYFGGEPDDGTFVDGWLPTGDIMRMGANGFIEIIDRKKEIYKNSRGETIAPQRIENLFSEFESVHHVFLVGDHRPYNTLLIHPNRQGDDSLLQEMDEEERQAFFASLVVSVNGFLMPYERIVDFRLIDRPFDAGRGELTPKGTYKRRVIEQTFDETIGSMYAKSYSSVIWDGIDIRIPTWFLRENGCLARDIEATADGLSIPKHGRRLQLARVGDHKDRLRIGDFVYEITGDRLDLQQLVTAPLNWFGNLGLFEFVGKAIITWYVSGRAPKALRVLGKARAGRPSKAARREFSAIVSAGERSLHGMHLAVLHLQSDDASLAYIAIGYLRALLNDESAGYRVSALQIAARPALVETRELRRALLNAGLGHISASELERLLLAHLTTEPEIFDSETVREVAAAAHTEDHLTAVDNVVAQLAEQQPEAETSHIALEASFALLAEVAVFHPTRFQRVRRTIVQYLLAANSTPLATAATKARETLRKGSRRWFGDNKRVAVDIESGEEYHWPDVITFAEGTDAEDQKRILVALETTCLLRESVFLFSGGRLVGLHDLQRGGICVSPLGFAHGKAVYRVRVQTRHHGAFDLALNLSKELPPEEVRNEVHWLIAAGAARGRPSLVEEVGGFWEDHQLWSEEYVPGETVARWLRRTLRRSDERGWRRVNYLWPFFVWNAAEAFIGLLTRTGFHFELRRPGPDNIIVPTHDYQTGTRIVSIADRRPFESVTGFLINLHECFVEETTREYEALRQGNMWRYILAGALESEGEKGGLELLQRVRNEQGFEDSPRAREMLGELDRFVAGVEETGHIPRRLFFAISRFHRWLDINEDASFSAQATTLRGLYDTYGLRDLERQNLETRTRFFLETVFDDSDDALRRGLEGLAQRQRQQPLSADEFLSATSSVQEGHTLTEKESYFLARLSYPHVQPSDQARLHQTLSDGAPIADLVVRIADQDGTQFSIRRPTSPREISRLHQIFFNENLRVEFREEHRFLVSVSERGHIIGGLFFVPPLDDVVHMEKIVVSRHFRRKGVGEALMTEFFARMRDQGAVAVTTGYFRPEYFYRQGFRVGPRYAGLVKDLGPE